MNNKSTRVNYVDIILLFVAVIIVAMFMFLNFDGNSQIDFSQKETVTLTLRIRNIPLKHSHLIKNGDMTYFASDEELLGKVKYVSYDDETVEFLDKLTNTSTIYKTPDKCTALLLLECEGTEADGVLSIGSRNIQQGDLVEAFVSNYSFSATVLKVENENG